jgi:serine/threonine protein phosphatase 1
MKINIIGDIAGRYDELMLLLEKMPEADLILSVGDLVDRGPKSKEVIEWFMNNKKAEAIYGNHEDLMVNAIVHKDMWLWIRNGGGATLRSYLPEGEESLNDVDVPTEHLQWLQTRPLWYQTDDLFVSHAPVQGLKYIPDQFDDSQKGPREGNFIWNRWTPTKPQDKFMIYGHNGQFKKHKWGDGSEFAMCIDNSHSGRLTGIHWPTKEIFSVDFLDREEHAEHYLDIKAE